MHLLLIRHGRPDRVELADGEVADPSLSETGRRQARALAERLAEEPLDAIYASTAVRAVQTAEPLAARHGLPIIERSDLLEYDFGSSSYVPVEEAAADDPMIARWLPWFEPTVPGGEVERYRRRIAAAMEEIVAAHRSQRVAVVSHTGTINAYLSGLLGVERAMLCVPEYSSVSRAMVSASGFWTLESLNERDHLDAEGEPVT